VIEGLEDRLLLSGSPTIYTVNSTGNGSTGTGTSGTLPYVISQANIDPNTAGTEIQFIPTVFGSPQTITPTSTLALNATAGPEVIDGPGANLVTINGNGAIGVFSVASATTATIAGLTLTSGAAALGGGVANSGTLTLDYCTVAGSHATSTSGGGIYNSGFLTLNNCTISTSTAASFGGGIDNTSTGTLTATNCTVAGNSAATAGGGIENDGMVDLTNCTVSNSTPTTPSGGGINNTSTGTLTAIDCTIANNSAGTGGGILNSGTTHLANCNIANNSAVNAGGIDNLNAAILSLANCTIAGNSATSSGGGIYNNTGASAVLANTIVGTNTASNNASGPDVFGAITSLGYNLIDIPSGGSGYAPTDLRNVNPLLSPLQNNGGPTPTMALLPGSPAIDAGSDALIPAVITTDQRGFARIANGNVDIGAFEVQVYMAYSTGDSGGGSLRSALNNANQAGGSVVVVTATGVIGLASALPAITQDVQILGPGANNLTISGSVAYRVFNITSGNTVTIAGLTLTNGSATTGGGIENDGTLFLTNCTVSNSTATAVGGGIYNSSTGTLTATNCTAANNAAATGGGIQNAGVLSLINCTIADNTAVGATSGNGGGIANTGILTLSDCTIAANSAHLSGGGIYNTTGASAVLANTIVGTNAAGSGSDISGNFTNQGGCLIGVNPVLGILQNNGGPTPTMAVLPGSPAIAAGNVGLIPAGITTDQRGVPRTFNSAVDSGAFQSRGFTITVSGGNNQRVLVNTAFPSPLVVTVRSSVGDPVQGGVVTFTTPTSGASVTFPNGNTAKIDASGVATVIVNANNVAGTYAVTPAAKGASGTNLSLTNLTAPVKFMVSLSGNNGKFSTGTPYTIVVQAVDASNNQTPGYRGSIQFISSRVATLPGYYTFVASDNGAHTFINGIVFGQTGVVYLTVYDTVTHISGQVAVTVGSGPPATATKAKSRRLVRKAPAASAKLRAHAAVELQSGSSSQDEQTVASAAGGSLYQAGVITRHAPAAARADAVREHVLGELRGSLRAYLAAERLAGARFE